MFWAILGIILGIVLIIIGIFDLVSVFKDTNKEA